MWRILLKCDTHFTEAEVEMNKLRPLGNNENHVISPENLTTRFDTHRVIMSVDLSLSTHCPHHIHQNSPRTVHIILTHYTKVDSSGHVEHKDPWDNQLYNEFPL